MEVAHLNQKQLAARWHVSEASLERWRCEGIGPKFLEICGRVLHRQADIEAYEERSLQTSTSQLAAAHAKATKQLPHDTVGMGARQLDAHSSTADDDDIARR